MAAELHRDHRWWLVIPSAAAEQRGRAAECGVELHLLRVRVRVRVRARVEFRVRVGVRVRVRVGVRVRVRVRVSCTGRVSHVAQWPGSRCVSAVAVVAETKVHRS